MAENAPGLAEQIELTGQFPLRQSGEVAKDVMNRQRSIRLRAGPAPGGVIYA